MSHKSDIKKERKFRSRKFFAWIISTLLMVAFLLLHKDAVIPFLPYYGGITMIYIGFQAVVDFVPAVVQVIKSWKGETDE